ncbi:acyltransferase [Hydrogenophaga sp. 5NK40-0174]|uniref:acyltransferase family protein n=1 Tax=Hydrogenophaga sp. 5NK40-0174 TaxID=3127649 RepID=UPI0031051315
MMHFNASLHGLRGLAALSVLLFHWLGRFPYFADEVREVPALGTEWDLLMLPRMGWVGVDWFFLLSGYVLAGTVWHKRLALGDILQFWKRRVLRIYPALWLQLATLLPLVVALGYLPEVDWVRVIGNATLWMRPLGTGVASYNNVYWSLVTEFSFYLLLPFLLILYRRVGPWPVLGLVATFHLLVVFGSALPEPLGVVHSVVSDMSAYLPGMQIIFVLGMLLHHVPMRLGPKAQERALWVAVAVYLLVLWWGHWVQDVLPRYHWSIDLWRILLGPWIALVIWLLQSPVRGTHWLGAKPMVWLGELSYGIYLWHLPVLSFADRWFPRSFNTPEGSLVILAVSLLATIALAAMSYYLVERPLLRRFSSVHRRQVIGGAPPKPRQKTHPHHRPGSRSSNNSYGHQGRHA